MEEEKQNERLVKSKADSTEEVAFDISLRPQTLDKFVGQEQIKQNLDISMQAAKQRNEGIEHIKLL
jgi:Holliday junction DNA helicase RuvB